MLARGENKASAKVGREGLQVDVRALLPETFGAAMQYFTGSKDHNVAIRMRAVKMGLKLSEYGLFRVADDARVAGETEEGIYQALGLPWIPPELRENTGEIEAAEQGRLPELVELRHIRGDLHMHTTETDGRATLEEMAEAARERGYEYIAITDHSKALAMTNGLDEKRVVEFARRVREINRAGLGIRVFSGIECDILKDGAMDLADDALAELDLVIGSVHSHMNLESGEMTDRLLRALECPHLRIMGHPTGRILLHRDPFPFDFDRVAAEAVRRGVWLEINASPERLDLHGTLIRTAKAKGAKFTISTDAHHPKHLGQHALRRGHGAPRMAGTGRHSEYARRRRVRARHPSQIMKITSSKQVYDCGLFRVTEDVAVDPKTKFEIKRSVVRHIGSAVMMAVDDKKRVLLVRQYRLPAEKYLWELPAGRLDPGEKPLQAAKRELKEETGYTARKWTKLASFWASPGFVQERMTIFLAEDLTAGEATPMDDERIEARWFKRKELAAMIADGKIEDAKTIVGFLTWRHSKVGRPDWPSGAPHAQAALRPILRPGPSISRTLAASASGVNGLGR